MENKTFTAQLKATQAEVTRWKQKYLTLTQQVKTLLVEHGLPDALRTVGVAEPFLPAAAALIGQRLQIREDAQSTLRAVIETDLGEVSIREYLTEWIQSPQGQALTRAVHDDGGPLADVAPVSLRAERGQQRGPNPFTTGNLTAQAKLKRENPKEYEQLRAEAHR
jgi:hypothetical protein